MPIYRQNIIVIYTIKVYLSNIYRLNYHTDKKIYLAPFLQSGVNSEPEMTPSTLYIQMFNL